MDNLKYMQLEEAERETHIYIPYQSKGLAELKTTDRFMMSKIEKLLQKDNSKWKLTEVQTALVTKEDGTKERQIVGKVYTAPIECVFLRPGKKAVSNKLIENLHKTNQNS